MMRKARGKGDSRQAARHRAGPLRGAAAFTLVELMMVLSVVAILATMAILMMRFAGSDVRATVYSANRRILQDQVVRYRADHGRDPAPERFREQMTMATNRAGDVAVPGTPGYPYGPYLKELPINPYTGGSSVGSDFSADWNVAALSGSAEDLSGLSRAHLSQLYAAAAAYFDERGTFPTSLQALCGAYISEETFQVVVISPRTGHTFSYRPAETPQGDAVLIQETGGGAGLLVCYADGRIEEGS